MSDGDPGETPVNIPESRFAVEMCPTCNVPVVRCSSSRGEELVEVEPAPDGDRLLRDTGGARPYVVVLAMKDRFGRQGQLRRLHRSGCRRRVTVAA